MVRRLNANDAAALTEQKVKDIETRAKQIALDKKIISTQAAKYKKLWQTQAKKLIESALSGESYLEVGTKLIGGDRLINDGLRIAIFDRNSLLEKKRRYSIEKKNNEKIRKEKFNKIRSDVDEKIISFIEKIEQEDRYRNMSLTRGNVKRRFLEVIKNYKPKIDILYSSDDDLFLNLFDSHLVLYQPIESLRLQVQTLQKSIQNLEAARRSSSAEENEAPEEANDFEKDFKSCQEYSSPMGESKIYLEPSECSQMMELAERVNSYLVEWDNSSLGGHWNYRNIISEKSLSWLSGRSGQNLLDAIYKEIHGAIESSNSSVKILMEEKDCSWHCKIASNIFHEIPSPCQMDDIFTMLKYKVQQEGEDSNSVALRIAW